MSIIGKKPYINTIIDELISDTNSGKDALNSLSNLINVANSTETTPIDFTNPLEKIYNYAELGNVCSVTYTSFKLYEGTVKKGFLILRYHAHHPGIYLHHSYWCRKHDYCATSVPPQMV